MIAKEGRTLHYFRELNNALFSGRLSLKETVGRCSVIKWSRADPGNQNDLVNLDAEKRFYIAHMSWAGLVGQKNYGCFHPGCQPLTYFGDPGIGQQEGWRKLV